MPATPAARVGDTLFALGALGTCISPALALVDALEPITPHDSVATDSAGAAILFVGASIALAAQAQMGTAWRAGIESLVRLPARHARPFRVVRNPFYLGICTASFGVSLIVPTALASATAAGGLGSPTAPVALAPLARNRASASASRRRANAALRLGRRELFLDRRRGTSTNTSTGQPPDRGAHAREDAWPASVWLATTR